MERYRSAALVNVVLAVAGIGAALLPLRKGFFFRDCWRRSPNDGSSGEEDIVINESSWFALVGEENFKPRVAIEKLMRAARMRKAHPSFGEDSRMERVADTSWHCFNFTRNTYLGSQRPRNNSVNFDFGFPSERGASRMGGELSPCWLRV